MDQIRKIQIKLVKQIIGIIRIISSTQTFVDANAT